MIAFVKLEFDVFACVFKQSEGEFGIGLNLTQQGMPGMAFLVAKGKVNAPHLGLKGMED